MTEETNERPMIEIQDTASEVLQMADQISRDDKIFRSYVEGFLRRWGPDDPIELMQFSADLMNIQRHIWLDTQNVAQKTLDRVMTELTKTAARYPLTPVTPNKNGPPTE